MFAENIIQVDVRKLLEHNILAHGGEQIVAILLFWLQFLSEDFLNPHDVVELSHLLGNFVKTFHALFKMLSVLEHEGLSLVQDEEFNTRQEVLILFRGLT